jgi:hypothetical protein
MSKVFDAPPYFIDVFAEAKEILRKELWSVGYSLETFFKMKRDDFFKELSTDPEILPIKIDRLQKISDFYYISARYAWQKFFISHLNDTDMKNKTFRYDEANKKIIQEHTLVHFAKEIIGKIQQALGI